VHLLRKSYCLLQSSRQTNPISTTAAPTSTLFGGTTAAKNNPTSTQPAPLFASLGTAPQLPGPSPFTNRNQQQVVPGVKIDISNVKPTTRFFELHDDIQKQIEHIDTFIQDQIAIFAQCQAFMPGHGVQLKTLPADVDFLKSKLETATLALDRDVSEISAVKEAVQSDIDDARRAFSAVETLKLPAQFQYSIGYTNSDSTSKNDSNPFAATDLTPYFEERIKDLDVRLNGYGSQLGEIEAHLRTVDSSATEQAHKLLRRQAGDDSGKERVQELGL